MADDNSIKRIPIRALKSEDGAHELATWLHRGLRLPGQVMVMLNGFPFWTPSSYSGYTQFEALTAHIGRDLWAASPLVQFPSGGQRKSLLSLPASLLSIAFAGQRLLDTEFLPRLQVKGVSLDFPDNVLLQNLPLEVAGSARAPSCRVGSGSGKKNAHRRTKGCRFGLH